MSGSDPYEVLGLRVDAGGDQIARAYRDLAKRHHPDRPGGSRERMAEINAAYDALRDGARRPAGADSPAPAGRRTRPARGHWLEPEVRRALGRELLAVLHDHETVLAMADTTTWDAFHVRLVATDPRLVWLRDDGITDRVRFLDYRSIATVEERLRRRGRTGELRVTPREGRRISFAEIDPAALRALTLAVVPRLKHT